MTGRPGCPHCGARTVAWCAPGSPHPAWRECTDGCGLVWAPADAASDALEMAHARWHEHLRAGDLSYSAGSEPAFQRPGP